MQFLMRIRIFRALFGFYPFALSLLLVAAAGLALGWRGLLLVAPPVLLGAGGILWFGLREPGGGIQTGLVARMAVWLMDARREGMMTDLEKMAQVFSVSPEQVGEGLTLVHELALAPFFWDKASGKVHVARTSGSLPHCPWCAVDLPDQPVSGRCKNCHAHYVLTCHKKPFYYI